MKLTITLTDEMKTHLLALAERERRRPRSQAEVLLEHALRQAVQAQADPEALARRLVLDLDPDVTRQNTP